MRDQRGPAEGLTAEPATTLVDEPSTDLPQGLAELAVSPTPIAEEKVPAFKMPAVGIARIFMLHEGGKLEIKMGNKIMPALLDPMVHPAVIRTADESGEPVMVEQRDGELYVVGALRTQPTPGVDKMETINLEAEHINLKAKTDITMTSGVAAIAVRAIGEVETYAERIMSRAESVHKIIGRMLRLN